MSALERASALQSSTITKADNRRVVSSASGVISSSRMISICLRNNPTLSGVDSNAVIIPESSSASASGSDMVVKSVEGKWAGYRVEIQERRRMPRGGVCLSFLSFPPYESRHFSPNSQNTALHFLLSPPV